MNLRPKADFMRGGELTNIDDLVVYINNILPQYNFNVGAIEKAIGLSHDLLGAKIRKSKRYSKEVDGLFIPISGTQKTQKTQIEPVPIKKPTSVSKSVNNSTNDFVTREEFLALKEQLDNLTKIMSQSNFTGSYDLDVKIKDEKSIARTMRIYPTTLDRFDKFCRLYPQYSKHEVISHIIDSFLDGINNK